MYTRLSTAPGYLITLIGSTNYFILRGMPLAEDIVTSRHRITAYSASTITVNDDIYDQSLVMTASIIHCPWPVTSLQQLNLENLAPIFESRPVVVLLGTGAQQLIKRKAPGYRQLAEQQLFNKHFTETTADGFQVLLLAPTPKRRDTIRRAFREADPVEYRSDLWRFASITEITPETFLDGDVFCECDDQPPRSLVRV